MPSDNTDFVTSVANALQIDKSEVTDILAGLNIEQMTDLIDAMKDKDVTAIKNIVDATDADKEVNPMFSHDEEDEENSSADDDNEVTESAEEYIPAFGDKVNVDGKSGIIKIAKGPSDTVGVMIDGKLCMARKNSVRRCNEASILCSDDVVDLRRIQSLAGIGNCEVGPETVQVKRLQTIDIPGNSPMQGMKVVSPVDIGMTKDDQRMATIDAAFKTIMDLLPDVRQRDVKTIRATTNKLITSLSESKGAPKKKETFSFLKKLDEERVSRPLSPKTIIDRVCQMGYRPEDAERMVNAYLDVLGAKKDDNPYSAMEDAKTVRAAIASLNNNK